MAGSTGRGQYRDVTRRVLLTLLLFVPLAISLRGQEPEALHTGDQATASFAESFREHLALIQGAAAALVDLGERRERNLLVISQRQAAMNAALDATDAWLDQQPDRKDDPAVAAYRTGADEIRQAMSDAQSAFLRFDWDGVAAAHDTLKYGVTQVTTAEDLLQPDAEH
ncbi:MAG: hypothetical protein R2853_11715 [Thermomicrobiales bacterium]